MIHNKKVLKVVKMICVSIILTGCSTKKAESGVEVKLFDMNKGREIIEGYFGNIREGNINKANNLCVDELLSNTKDLTEGVSEITSFSEHETIEGNKSGYFIFNVIRSSIIEPKSDLEVYTIKVENSDKDYKITDIKSKADKTVYVKNNTLRIIGEDGGKSNLVISLNNIPQDTYLSDNKIMLYKEKVPREGFGKIGIGFEGKKIAISTEGDNNSYICIAYIDDTLMKGGGYSDPDKTKEGSESSSEQSLEKPVINKLVSLDLLKNSQVNDFMFSKEDENVAVNYKNNKGINRVKIYKTEDGTIVDVKIDEVFSEEKYNIWAEHFTEDELRFKSSLVKGATDYDKDLVGDFIINLKTLELSKI